MKIWQFCSAPAPPSISVTCQNDSRYKRLCVLKSQLWFHGIKWPWPRWFFDVESLSCSSCKRRCALNLSDRSQIHLNKKKTQPNQTKQKTIDLILIFLLQYTDVLPGNCPTQIFMNVRPQSFIAFAQRITSFNEFYHAHGTQVFNE